MYSKEILLLIVSHVNNIQLISQLHTEQDMQLFRTFLFSSSFFIKEGNWLSFLRCIFRCFCLEKCNLFRQRPFKCVDSYTPCLRGALAEVALDMRGAC